MTSVDAPTVAAALHSHPPNGSGVVRGPVLATLLVVAFVAAASSLLSRASDRQESLKAAVVRSYRDAKRHHSGLVHQTAGYVVITYLVLLAASAFVPRVRSLIELDALYYVAVGLLGLSLSITDSCRPLATAKLAAAVGVVLVVVDGMLGVLGRPYGFRLTLLVVVLMAVVAVRLDGRQASTAGTGSPTRYPVAAVMIGLLVLLSSILYSYRLGSFHLYDDEFFAFDTAVGFLRTGTLYQWDWIAMEPGERYYPRAWPHTLLVSASFAVFGVSEWSARLFSAAFGVLTVPTTYYVVRYFTGRTAVALATALALVIYPNVISYFRWTRMYALLIPVFMVATYLVCRVLTEEYTGDVGIRPVDRLIDRHLNFNVRLGMLTLPVLYVAYEIHYNALLVVAAGFAFVLFKAATTRERRYLGASIVGLAGVVAVGFVFIYTPYLDDLYTLLSFFERRNVEYVTYLFQYPFAVGFGGLLFAAGAVMAAKVEDAHRRDKLTFLYVFCLFSIVFYVFVGDRYVAFAYVLHVIPFAIALVLFAYFEFSDAVGVAAVEAVLVVLLVASMLHAGVAGGLRYDNPYGSTYRDLYVDDEVDFTEAYGTIERSFDPERDVVIGFAIRDYYLRDLPEDAVVIDIASYDGDTERFYEDVRRQEAGWITWPSSKAHHIDPEMRAYVETNFEQHHGRSVDDTNVEVFYFNDSMVNRTPDHRASANPRGAGQGSRLNDSPARGMPVVQ